MTPSRALRSRFITLVMGLAIFHSIASSRPSAAAESAAVQQRPTQTAYAHPQTVAPKETVEVSPETAAPKAGAPLTSQAPGRANSSSAAAVTAPKADTEPRSLPTGDAETTVSAQSISLPGGAGTITGMGESFSAQLATGMATFKVPISVPSARGKAQPSLSLSYSSSSGAGTAGVGWDLPVAFIARQTDRGLPSYDDRPNGPWHPNQDRFIYNGGQELVPICMVVGTGCDNPQQLLPTEQMPVWAAGWQYFRARVEGAFLRFFWSPDRRTWRVQSKDGLTMEFGVPLDGASYDRALEVNPRHPQQIYKWLLVRQYDAYGDANIAGAVADPVNRVVYRYYQDGGTAYLTDIFHTTPTTDPRSRNLDTYAHHVHVLYEQRTDPTESYRRGWAVAQNLRLARVDVASKTFIGAASAARTVVRRYHAKYDARYHASLLESIQIEGRCGPTPLVETARATQCGDAQGCKGFAVGKTTDPACLLPPVTFGYSHVDPGGAPVLVGSNGAAGGYEAFGTSIRQIEKSPLHSIDEALTDFFDINSDGLPDVVVTAPGLFAGKHGLFLNTPETVAGSGRSVGFRKQTMCVKAAAIPGVDAAALSFDNINVQALDLDADGITNLVHMPRKRSYGIFTPAFETASNEWCWNGRGVTTTDGADLKIDFARDARQTRIFDVNYDGLVDVVVSSATEMQTYFALGRYPGGDGQFGWARWASADRAEIHNEPVTSCVPWSSQAARLGDDDVRVGDMNGDSIPDIVRVRSGDVRYWPGRGDGYWGTGEKAGCLAGFGQDQSVAMNFSPRFGVVGAGTMIMSDANGDGLFDLIEVRTNGVDIYLNVDGTAWTERYVIADTPAVPIASSRVRLLDIDGSATPDIVWGEGHAYRYIDLGAGRRSWLLTRFSNGLGKTTDVEYTTSIDEMRSAAATGRPWTRTMPLVIPVVKRVSETDNLRRAGGAVIAHVSEYSYRDPFYEGRQREFRGFSSASLRRLGDANSPTSIADTQFLTGECIDEVSRLPCKIEERWRDNPREGLKGLRIVSETRDAAGVYLSTERIRYRLRQLYKGLDGRAVRHPFSVGSETLYYDTGAFVPATNADESAPVVELETAPGTVTSDLTAALPVRSTQGLARTKSAAEIDVFGNQTKAISLGCTSGPTCSDEVITVTSVPGRPTGDPTGWMWRVVETFVQGNQHSGNRRRTFVQFNAQGDPVGTTAELVGTGGLQRSRQGGGAVAQLPATASQDGTIALGFRAYDQFGNVVREIASNGRCRELGYDALYTHLTTVERIATTGDPTVAISLSTANQACPVAQRLDVQAEYDRGFGLVTVGTDFTGQPTIAAYDGFARMISLTRPNPDAPAVPSPLPTTKYEYDLARPGRPYSLLRTSQHDGFSIVDNTYLESWTFVDGFGRKIVTLHEADTLAGDAQPWIASGLAEYDAKGGMKRRYVDFFANPSDPRLFDPQAVVTARFVGERHDAFGRAVEITHLDGGLKQRSVYHALSADLYDADDAALGTFATQRMDGHGRVKELIQRFNEGGSLKSRSVLMQYLPTNETEVVRRRLNTTGTEVVRWYRYDSLGRMVLNVEPNTSVGFTADHTVPDSIALKAWRYVYSNSGQLVGTSDARGCGVNFHYDGAGRLVAEDYSPCLPNHSVYSAPNFTSRAGIEVLYQYDQVPLNPAGMTAPPGSHGGADPLNRVQMQFFEQFLRGRLVATWSRGAVNFSAYDGRGRLRQVAARMARPFVAGQPRDDFPLRYSPRWYQRDIQYDAADREVRATTGASVADLMGAPVTVAGASKLSAWSSKYSARGTVVSAGGSYDAAGVGAEKSLIRSVVRDADGRLRTLEYGDRAITTSTWDYDDRRRPSFTHTNRAIPDLWNSPSSYTPAPNPSGAPTSFQTALRDESFSYDPLDRLIEMRDWRIASEWPDGAKPVTTHFEYDDLSRMTRVDYQHAAGSDGWFSPFDRENTAAAADKDPRRADPVPHVSFDQRLLWQRYEYDWLDNATLSDDDKRGFYDRSLGGSTPGTANAGPYQLRTAGNESLSNPSAVDRRGHLSTAFDRGGNLTGLAVVRRGPCLPAAVNVFCSQRFAYDWDEVGRLVLARRWDLPAASVGDASSAPPGSPATVELRYEYDAGDERTLKIAAGAGLGERYTVYIFQSLELRRAGWSADAANGGALDYELTAFTEVPYLFPNGTRVARVVFEHPSVPTLPGASQRHVFLELANHLGSNHTVVDQATGELVERGTYQAYGGSDSDYRPLRWRAFREDYRFSGKEEDVEVGLHYFGKRYYSPFMNRWISPDPLRIHGNGGDFNVYGYVGGNPVTLRDPKGLDFGASLIAGFVIGASVELGRQIIEGEDIKPGAIAVAGLAGMVGGATGYAVGLHTTAAGGEALGVICGGAASGAANDLTVQLIMSGEYEYRPLETLLAAGGGALTGLLQHYVVFNIKSAAHNTTGWGILDPSSGYRTGDPGLSAGVQTGNDIRAYAAADAQVRSHGFTQSIRGSWPGEDAGVFSNSSTEYYGRDIRIEGPKYPFSFDAGPPPGLDAPDADRLAWFDRADKQAAMEEIASQREWRVHVEGGKLHLPAYTPYETLRWGSMGASAAQSVGLGWALSQLPDGTARSILYTPTVGGRYNNR